MGESIDMLTFLKDNFKDVLYIIGAIMTFFIGKKVRKLGIKQTETTVQAGELENVEAALKIYRTMLTDLGEKLKEAEAAYNIIEQRYHKAMSEKQLLIEENKVLKKKLEGLNTII